MSQCTDCGGSNQSYVITTVPCTGNCSAGDYDASCVNYSGPALTCIDKPTNTDLQTIIQAIDALVCEASAIDWTAFDYGCLTDGYEITNAQTFAERISDLYCTLKSDYDDFTGTTYTDAIENLQDQIDTTNTPAITVACASITSADNLVAVLTKIGTKLCSINTAVNPSGADWGQCYSVPSHPTTITAGFDLVIDWICTIEATLEDIALTLPTFNNASSCLSITGTTDTLYNTVVAIRNKLCTKPDFDATEIDGCVFYESGDNLQSIVGKIVDYISFVGASSILQVDETQFTLTPIDEDNSCSGFKLSLAEDITSTDRFVASNSDDDDPGTLMDKLLEGDNITLDDTTTPGKVIITAASTDEKVKASITDNDPGYLIDKLTLLSSSGGEIVLGAVYNSGTKKVDITPTVNFGLLAATLLSTIEEDSDLYTTLCNLNCGCPTCPAEDSKILFKLINLSGDDIPVGLEAAQNTPTLNFISTPTITITAMSNIVTGSYAITSTGVPLIGKIILDNAHDAEITYSIEVKDSLGVVIVDADTESGTLGIGATATFDNYIFGTNSGYFVEITIDLV